MRAQGIPQKDEVAARSASPIEGPALSRPPSPSKLPVGRPTWPPEEPSAQPENTIITTSITILSHIGGLIYEACRFIARTWQLGSWKTAIFLILLLIFGLASLIEHYTSVRFFNDWKNPPPGTAAFNSLTRALYEFWELLVLTCQPTLTGYLVWCAFMFALAVIFRFRVYTIWVRGLDRVDGEVLRFGRREEQ